LEKIKTENFVKFLGFSIKQNSDFNPYIYKSNLALLGAGAKESQLMNKVQFQEIVDRLDEQIGLLKQIATPKSRYEKIVDNIVTIVAILGIIAVIDIIISWVKGG
jgi:hypothetical protein